jgi:hypothetical protein
MYFHHKMIRPEIHGFEIDGAGTSTPELSPDAIANELMLSKWGWVSFYDLYWNTLSVRNALLHDPFLLDETCSHGELATFDREQLLLLEFADFQGRKKQRFPGIGLMKEVWVPERHCWMHQLLRRPNAIGLSLFLWGKTDIKKYRELVFSESQKDFYVPSGWVTMVIDEVERRNAVGEHLFQALCSVVG